MADEEKQQPGTVQTPPESAPDKSGKGAEDTNPVWLPERLAKAKASAENGLLKKLGFESVDDLAALVTKARDADKAQMSEIDRLKADLTLAAKERDEARYAADTERHARQVEKIENAILHAATTARAEIPADVLTLLKAAEKLDPEALLDDKGVVKPDAVKALVDGIKKDRPGWFGRTGVGSPSNAGGRPPEPDQQNRDKAAKALNANLRNRF